MIIILKLKWKNTCPVITKIILTNKNKAERTTLPDIKSYCKHSNQSIGGWTDTQISRTDSRTQKKTDINMFNLFLTKVQEYFKKER